MKIGIQNLGFVKNVELDLSKDLIILCGPNNTGKTYVAYATYGLMKFRSDLPKFKKVTDGLRILLLKGHFDFDIVDLLKDGADYLDGFAKSYVKNIYKVFASDESLFSKTLIDIKLGNEKELEDTVRAQMINQELGIRNSLSFRLTKEQNSTILSCILIESEKSDASINVENNSKRAVTSSIIMEFLADRISDIILSFIFPKAFISPAERIAINIFSKELSLKRNVLVDKLLELKDIGKDDDPFDLIKRRASRYPLPIRDSLEIAEDLINFKKNKSEYDHFATEIENDILKGQVIISKEGDVQFKPEKAKSLKLPIHLTASVVKSLSNLVIYFRHLATKGDFIIIDEPELNLHPDNQVVIARIIAKIVNNGFKVMINTHSDYIIREINNLIMINHQPNYIINHKIPSDYLLSSERIDAILFKYDNRKAMTLNVSESGFEVSTIDEVINDLNNRSQELYFKNYTEND